MQLRSQPCFYKGVDGTLYHSKHIIDELTQSGIKPGTGTEWKVYQLGKEMKRFIMPIKLESEDYQQKFLEVRRKIGERTQRDNSSKWLIEVGCLLFAEDPTLITGCL
jgi:hypothetical protein